MRDEKAVALWNQYVQARQQVEILKHRLFAEERTMIPELIRRSLKDPHECLYALEAAAMLPIEERKELLPDLVAVASYAGAHLVRARQLILSLPIDWLIQNIEAASEPLLEYGDAEEFRRILELYSQLQPALTARLAERASTHTNPEVRSAGEDFMSSR
jgi:hypothetical protein